MSGFNIPDANCKFVAGYNKTFKDKLNNKLIYDMVDQNIQLLDLLCPYLPDIHFVKTEFETSVAIYNIIQKEISSGRIVPNVIVSADTYPIQLTTLLDDTVYIRPKKNLGEDISEIVCPRGHVHHQNSFWGIICQEKDDFVLNESAVSVSSRNYVLLAALNKFYDRNYKCIVNFTKANKIINSITGGADIVINPNMLDKADPKLIEGLPLQIIDSRFKALDVIYQDILYNESVEPMVLNFENLSDSGAIQLINDKYFTQNPIDIFKL